MSLRLIGSISFLTVGGMVVGYVVACIASGRLGRLQRLGYVFIGIGAACAGMMVVSSDSPAIYSWLCTLFVIVGMLLEIRSMAINEPGRHGRIRL